MTIDIVLARIGGYQTDITHVVNKIAISILLLRIACQRTVVTNIGPAIIVVTVDDRRQGGIEGEHVERKGAKAPLKCRAGVGVVAESYIPNAFNAVGDSAIHNSARDTNVTGETGGRSAPFPSDIIRLSGRGISEAINTKGHHLNRQKHSDKDARGRHFHLHDVFLFE